MTKKSYLIHYLYTWVILINYSKYNDIEVFNYKYYICMYVLAAILWKYYENGLTESRYSKSYFLDLIDLGKVAILRELLIKYWTKRAFIVFISMENRFN